MVPGLKPRLGCLGRVVLKNEGAEPERLIGGPLPLQSLLAICVFGSSRGPLPDPRQVFGSEHRTDLKWKSERHCWKTNRKTGSKKTCVV